MRLPLTLLLATLLLGLPASAQSTAADIKAAQVAVDAALKVRKQRLTAWQGAAKAKDVAATDVAKKKKSGVTGAPLEEALQRALLLDEQAAVARSSLLAAEAAVARGGAELLKHYDLLLVQRRRAVEALSGDARLQAAAAYRTLAAQRDAVRQALLPVLPSASAVPADLPPGLDLEARAGDDVEVLLEKADLALDLEERFLRQAQAVRRRIVELDEEQAVARDVSGMVGRGQLFDEEDRRLPVVRVEPARQGGGGGGPASSRTPSPAEADDGVSLGESEVPQGSPSAPPSPIAESGGRSPSVAALSGPAPPARPQQGFTVPQTNAGMAGLLSSGATVESLRALESRLKVQAQQLREKSKKLKTEAQTRARD